MSRGMVNAIIVTYVHWQRCAFGEHQCGSHYSLLGLLEVV